MNSCRELQAPSTPTRARKNNPPPFPRPIHTHPKKGERNADTMALTPPSRTEPQHQPLCAITNYPARYRDPGTGLPYANFHAYREIQRLRRGDYKWSALLGAWVGSCTSAARGVPERFLNADKAREMKQQRDRERAEKKVEEEAEEESKTKEKKMQPQQDKAREGEVQESETKEEAKHEGQNALSAEDGVSLKRDQGAGAGVKADEDEAAAAQEPPPTLHADPTKTSA